MGSQSAQSKLWGQRAKDWSAIQEQTGNPGYEYVLHFIKPKPSDKILDIGCGSGFFANLAAKSGAEVTGIDATLELIEAAKLRNPSIKFMTGEMEELPFADNTFNIVTGFNSFQFAANINNAFLQAKRVLKKQGVMAVMIWGNKKDCEANTYLEAIGSLLPPPPPNAPGPFALTENDLLEKTLNKTGFDILTSADLDAIWDYPDIDTAIKGLLSAGPAAKAIDNSGYDKTYQTVLEAMQPYVKNNGHVVYRNKFRVVIAEKKP